MILNGGFCYFWCLLVSLSWWRAGTRHFTLPPFFKRVPQFLIFPQASLFNPHKGNIPRRSVGFLRLQPASFHSCSVPRRVSITIQEPLQAALPLPPVPVCLISFHRSRLLLFHFANSFSKQCSNLSFSDRDATWHRPSSPPR